MNGFGIKILTLLTAIVAMILVAGCLQQGSTPTATPQPTPASTAPPVPSVQAASPTPIGGSDEAHISFTYTIKTYPTGYEGIPNSPGKMIYAIDVKVDSDKPVLTDDTWFGIDYQKNSSTPVETIDAYTPLNYPAKTIGDGSGPAAGRLLFFDIVPPENGFGGIRPYYFKPLNGQTGEYKVKKKYYGVISR